MSDEKAKSGIVNRLRTIKGHINGIEKMIDDGKSCDEILLQIAAIKASVHKVGIAIMEEHAMECLFTEEDGEPVDREKMEEVIKTFVKYSK